MLYRRLLYVLVMLSMLIVDVHATECQGDSTPSGLCWPTEGSELLLGWHGLNPDYSGKFHLAQDIRADEGDDVYAIEDGKMLHNRTNVSGYGGFGFDGGGLIIKCQTPDEQYFTVLYGHVKNISVSVGSTVTKGQKIAEVGPYTGGTVHLHSGIRFPFNDDGDRWAGYGSTDKGFVNPTAFLNRVYYRKVSDQYFGREISIYWTPSDVSCVNATGWCYETCSANHTNSVCYDAYDELKNINWLKYIHQDWYNTFFGNQAEFDSVQQCGAN